MNRVFAELSDREDEIAQMYGAGLEVKEVAKILFRSAATVSNHMQSIYAKLKVRNRSELSIKMMERLGNMRFSLELSPVVKASVACFLLGIFFVSLHREQGDMRRSRRIRIERIERTRRAA